MKYLILLLFLLLIYSNCIAQGLGMSYDEILEAREGEEFIDGNENGLPFLMYQCDNDQACSYTTYYFDKDNMVKLVVDAFVVDGLISAIEYLNQNFEKEADDIWYNYKTKCIISLVIYEEKSRFELHYKFPED